MKLTGLIPDALEEGAGNAVYMKDKVRTKQSSSEDEYNEHLYTAVYQRIIPPISEVYLYVNCSYHDSRLLTLNKKLFKNHPASVAQRVLEVIPTRPFIIKVASWLSQEMLTPKREEVETCLRAPSP